MSRLFAITVSYCNPEILAHGLTRFVMTAGAAPDRYVLVNHLWPIEQIKTEIAINRIAHLVDATVIKPAINRGGAGGFNFGLEYLDERCRLLDDDVILGMDPDSNPLTPNWLKTMEQVMRADQNLMSLSLMHEHIVERPWQIKEIAGFRVAFLPHPEMQNVTIWRAGAIKDGLMQQGFYGHTERLMWKGGRCGYLYDFRETLCPVPHPKEYNEWKRKTAFEGLTINFDEYLKNHGDADAKKVAPGACL